LDSHIKNLKLADENAFLFPWRGRNGTVDPNRMHSQDTIDSMRERFRKRWNLPILTSRQMRKFVKGILIDSGMPDPQKSYWQGHQGGPDANPMDFDYGTKQVDETFASQLSYLPNGPMGIFVTEEASNPQPIPMELVRLWKRLDAKEFDAMDLAAAAKELIKRRKVSEMVTP
jgi:hypothetical protein